MQTRFRPLVLLPLLAALGCAAQPTQAPAVAAPATVRDTAFSAERLARLTRALDAYVADGRLPGAVVLVQHQGGVVHLGVHGWRDMETESPMQADTIFRIASQTKALVSVGIMMLQEEGRLLIGDPLDRWLPEFAQTTVAVAGKDGGWQAVPASRKVTLRDLLTHTAGIGYGYDGPGAQAWREAGIQGWYFADREEPIRETVRRMAALPFEAQPGERYVYGYSTDILGAVIEVASGQSLDAFLHERLLAPLGMVDTHFYLPPEKAGRLATVYALGDDGVLKRAPDESNMLGQGGYLVGPRTSFSGGAGLLSTVHDYARFQQMLLNGGSLDGRRYLSPGSVALMTANHLTPPAAFPWAQGTGFGLGFGVLLDLGARGTPGSVGEYGWGGAYHTTYWMDPAQSLTVTYFTQVIPAGDLDDHARVRALVYQALLQ